MLTLLRDVSMAPSLVFLFDSEGDGSGGTRELLPPPGAPSTSVVIRSELSHRSSRTRALLGASLRSDPSHPDYIRIA
jgi:hypothetical protein